MTNLADCRRCACGCGKIIKRKNTYAHGHNRRTHGQCSGYKKGPTYTSWAAMIARCENPDNGKGYYADRGVTIHPAWRESYDAFLADMGERPEGMSLDRIDPTGSYAPDNCRWATSRQQVINRRNTRWVTWAGRTMIAKDWARELGISYPALLNRLNKWTLEDAMTLPVGQSAWRNRK